MNTIVIALDTQRRDHLSCYGYPRATSPNLDALAAEGALFENCITNTAHTMPTFTTMISGLDPGSHGIVGTLFSHPDEPDQRLSDRQPVLAEMLRQAGILTAAFDNLADFGCHPSWFVRGHQFYVNIWAPRASHCSQVLAEEINAHLLPWLKQYAAKGPFYLFVHYWDPHQAYNQPEPYRTMHTGGAAPTAFEVDGREHIPSWGWTDRLDEASREKIDLYDGELSYVDNAIGDIVQVLKAQGVYDDTGIVITADHGEDLQEHNAPFEHREPYETTIGIPLIFKPPTDAGIAPGTRVEGIVGNVDLMPSVLDLAGIEAPEGIDGRSWLPMARGEMDSIHESLLATGGAIKQKGTWKSPEVAIRTDRHKYIRRGTAHYYAEQTSLDVTCLAAPAWRGQPGKTDEDKIEYFNALPRRELYDLQRDPNETVNIAESEPETVARLDEVLQGHVAKQPHRLIVD